MSPGLGLPLEELGSTPRERRFLRRLGVVVAAVVVGATAGIGAYAWADSKIAKVDTRVAGVESGLAGHLQEMAVLRPQMDRYVREEREARCSMALNVYRLCRRTSTDCLPVSASCAGYGDR